MARRNRACTRIQRLVFINYSMTLHKIGVHWSYEASPDAMSVVKGLAPGRLLALKSGSNKLPSKVSTAAFHRLSSRSSTRF